MATPQEKAPCVEWFIETISHTQVQHNFCIRYARNPLLQTGIREWCKRLKETGICQKRVGRPSTSAADVERVCESFQQSPRKSICCASGELGLPTTTKHKILHSRLKLFIHIWYNINIRYSLSHEQRLYTYYTGLHLKYFFQRSRFSQRFLYVFCMLNSEMYLISLNQVKFLCYLNFKEKKSKFLFF